MKLTHVTSTGSLSSISASDVLFGLEANPVLLAQAIRVYLSNLRQGTSKVKSRGEVARTKRKWYKQKGTGNARHAARSAPIFVGGGVAHGPKGIENWSLSLSTKMKRRALCLALTAQAQNVRVVDSYENLDGKTKSGQAMVTMLGAENKKILAVVAEPTSAVERSLRNLQEVLLMTSHKLTALEVSTADLIVVTPEVLKTLEDRVAGTSPVTSVKAAVKAVKATKAPAEVKAPAKAKAKPVAKKPVAKKAAVKTATTKKSVAKKAAK